MDKAVFSSLSFARSFSTTAANAISKVKYKRLVFYNKKHLRVHKEQFFKKFESDPKHEHVHIHKYGCRGTGIRHDQYWEKVPEMVPELVVPDLTGFKLKPYVSYATKDIYQEELTSKDLFNALYGKKIIKDFQEGKLDEKGNSSEPSEDEKMSADEAYIKARKTGSDIFLGGVPRSKLWNVRWSMDP